MNTKALFASTDVWSFAALAQEALLRPVVAEALRRHRDQGALGVKRTSYSPPQAPWTSEFPGCATQSERCAVLDLGGAAGVGFWSVSGSSGSPPLRDSLLALAPLWKGVRKVLRPGRLRSSAVAVMGPKWLRSVHRRAHGTQNVMPRAGCCLVLMRASVTFAPYRRPEMRGGFTLGMGELSKCCRTPPKSGPAPSQSAGRRAGDRPVGGKTGDRIWGFTRC